MQYDDLMTHTVWVIPMIHTHDSWVIPKTSILFIYSSNLLLMHFHAVSLQHFQSHSFNRTLFTHIFIARYFSFLQWFIEMTHHDDSFATYSSTMPFYCERTLTFSTFYFSALSSKIYESYNVTHIMTHIYSSFCIRNVSKILKILNKYRFIIRPFIWVISYADVGGQHCLCPVRTCPCLVFVRNFRKIVFGVCMLSGFLKNADRNVRCLSAVWIQAWFCLSRFCPLSGILYKILTVVYLSGQIMTRQSFPDFHCPCPPTSALTSEMGIYALKFKAWTSGEIGRIGWNTWRQWNSFVRFSGFLKGATEAWPIRTSKTILIWLIFRFQWLASLWPWKTSHWIRKVLSKIKLRSDNESCLRSIPPSGGLL